MVPADEVAAPVKGDFVDGFDLVDFVSCDDALSLVCVPGDGPLADVGAVFFVGLALEVGHHGGGWEGEWWVLSWESLGRKFVTMHGKLAGQSGWRDGELGLTGLHNNITRTSRLLSDAGSYRREIRNAKKKKKKETFI